MYTDTNSYTTSRYILGFSVVCPERYNYVQYILLASKNNTKVGNVLGVSLRQY